MRITVNPQFQEPSGGPEGAPEALVAENDVQNLVDENRFGIFSREVNTKAVVGQLRDTKVGYWLPEARVSKFFNRFNLNFPVYKAAENGKSFFCVDGVNHMVFHLDFGTSHSTQNMRHYLGMTIMALQNKSYFLIFMHTARMQD